MGLVKRVQDSINYSALIDPQVWEDKTDLIQQSEIKWCKKEWLRKKQSRIRSKTKKHTNYNLQSIERNPEESVKSTPQGN